jgi:hypothetical protein
MDQSSFSPTIDEYLRKRLMPVEGAIPQLAGIDMYGNSIPAGIVGGDLFEHINFQQRYNIDGRIARADLRKRRLAVGRLALRLTIPGYRRLDSVLRRLQCCRGLRRGERKINRDRCTAAV